MLRPLLLLALAAPPAGAHGPLPEVLSAHGDPPVSLRTTHGILRKDSHWRWICPDVFAPALSGAPLPLDSGRLLVGTTDGLRFTDDGCSWSRAEGLEGYVAQLEQEEDGALWALSPAGLMASADEGATWTLADPVDPGASLRAFVRTGPDAFAVAGWSTEDAPALWVGVLGLPWLQLPVPFDVGQLMEPLGLGPEGDAWFNYPVRGIGTVLRVSAAGEVEEVVRDVGDVGGLVVEGGLPHLGTRDGILRSDDGGATWQLLDDAGLNGFTKDGHGWLGCMDALAGRGAVARWHEEGWEPEIELGEVAGPPECPADAVGSTDSCQGQWEEVLAAFERGIDPPGTQAPPVEDEAPVGCSQGGGASAWGLLLLLVGRRRDQASSSSRAASFAEEADSSNQPLR